MLLFTVSLLMALSVGAQVTLAPSNAPSSPTNLALAWNASPSTNVAGYRLCWGTNSGAYLGKLDVSNSLTAVVTMTNRGVVYYFAAVAYTLDGQESDFSNEITNSAPNLVVQSALALSPNGSVAYGSTNSVTISGGSGAGSVSFQVLSGPGYLTGVVSNTLVANGVGTIVLAATKAGDGTYLAASLTNSITVALQSQTITFPTIASQKQTNTVTLSASASSGLSVSYAVQSGPGVLSASKLSFSAPGTVVIVASQSGSAVTNARTTSSLTSGPTSMTTMSVTRWLGAAWSTISRTKVCT